MYRFFLPSDRPKIRLPRFLRQRYVKNVGEKINLVIPFSVCNLLVLGSLKMHGDNSFEGS